MRSPAGAHLARLDLAWPGAMVAVEADGRGWHGLPEALHRDRRRANALELLGWTLLRVTWQDVVVDPAAVSRWVRRALSR